TQELARHRVAASRQSAANSGEDNCGALPRRRYGQMEELINFLRGDLDCIVMKCLEKDRARRYETASGVSADLKRYLDNEPVLARPPSLGYRFHKFVRRHKGAVAAATAVAVALILGLGFATFAFLRERQARLRQGIAEKGKQAETVRADAVAEFMRELLSSTAPELLRQGHQRPVRDLLKAADRLASTGLANAPAAELQLRDLMTVLYLGELTSLLDSPAAYQQMTRITELLPSVPEDKLRSQIYPGILVPRDEYRLRAAISSIWAGHTEVGLAELQSLKAEFGRRTPRADQSLALCLAAEGNWRLWKREAGKAETQLTDALRLLPADSPPLYLSGIRIQIAMALADRGAAAEAEKVARAGLLPPANVTPELAGLQVVVLSRLADALCQQ